MVVPRKELAPLLAVLQKDYPDLLITVEDIRMLHDRGPTFFGK
jgi:hypothetical protein